MMNNIGFGCVRLTYNYTQKQAVRNLEVAYDHGVRHFDAARLYGFGLAEGILGQFAKNKRSDITITTKFGIFPNNALLKNLLLQNVVRDLFRLTKKLPFRKSTQNIANTTAVKNFNVKNVNLSLQTSLKEIGTDYIDYLLLHEATVEEANNEELIAFLEMQKQKGVIGNYGLGSFTDKLMSEFPTLDKRYSVLQTDNSFPAKVPSMLLNAEHIDKRFYFSPFNNLAAVRSILKNDPAFKKQISDQLGFDALSNILDMFLMQQRFENPKGTVLFTSSKNENIIKTLKCWEHVIALPQSAFKGFSEVRQLISDKLDNKA